MSTEQQKVLGMPVSRRRLASLPCHAAAAVKYRALFSAEIAAASPRLYAVARAWRNQLGRRGGTLVSLRRPCLMAPLTAGTGASAYFPGRGHLDPDEISRCWLVCYWHVLTTALITALYGGLLEYVSTPMIDSHASS